MHLPYGRRIRPAFIPSAAGLCASTVGHVYTARTAASARWHLVIHPLKAVHSLAMLQCVQILEAREDLSAMRLRLLASTQFLWRLAKMQLAASLLERDALTCIRTQAQP